MSRPQLLTQEQIEKKLKGFPLWHRDGKEINREFEASNFTAAIGIVNSIAIIAEKNDHHPDILIYGWNKVRVTLSTHDQGGLTELDFKSAEDIESLKF